MIKVILVGNSAALLRQSNGEVIDSMDKVVRFNNGNPVKYPKELGTRTDYWSFSTMHYEMYNRWKIPNAVPMLLNQRIKYPVSLPDAIYNDGETYADLINTYEHPRPSTGLITAHYISRKWGCDLYCVGFDFFRSATWCGGSNKNTPHSGKLEEAYMKGLGVTIL